MRFYKKSTGEYPRNWSEISKDIIKRENGKCFDCGRLPSNLEKNYVPCFNDITTKEFRVHHKDLNRSNNEPSNLVYLCGKCHGRRHREINQKYKHEMVSTSN